MAVHDNTHAMMWSVRVSLVRPSLLLPLAELGIWALLLSIPMTTRMVRTVQGEQGWKSIRLENIESSMTSAVWRNSHIVTALNIPAIAVDILISSRVVASGARD